MSTRLYIILTVLLTTGVFGCTETGDTPEPKLPDPEISIVWEGNPAVLHQIEKISLESIRINEITGVKLYLGNMFVAEDTEAPFEINWNTEAFEDGEYELRVLAHTSKNAEVEKTMQVTISNVLLRAVVPVGAFGRDSEDLSFDLWLYLTDEHSNLIGSVQPADNAEEIIWMRPKGFTRAANLNIFSISEVLATSYKYYTLSTYLNYPINYYKPQLPSAYPTSSGKSVNLNIINDSGAESIRSYAYSKGYPGYFSTIVETTMIHSVPVHYENNNILVLQQQQYESNNTDIGEYRYQFVSASSGTTKDVTFSQGLKPHKTDIPLHDKSGYASILSVWNMDGNFFAVPGYSSSEQADPAFISPVSGENSVVYVNINGSSAQGDFNVVKPVDEIGTHPDVPTHLMVPTQLIEGSLSLQSSGTADVFNSWGYAQPSNEHSMTWQVWGPHDNNNTIHIPVIPAEILTDHSGLEELALSLKLNKVASTNYVKLNGYSEYINDMLQPSKTHNEFIDILGGFTSYTLDIYM